MVIELLSSLHHDCTYLILYLSAALLGFFAGRLRYPLIYCKPSSTQEERRGAEPRTVKHLGNRGKAEERRMNTSKDDQRLGATQREKMEVYGEPMKEERGLRRRKVRSLSLGRRPVGRSSILKKEDSNPRPVQGESEEISMQRKPSLTGEEVKEMADAFIARVRERMRLQREESLKLRSEEVANEAPPPP